MTSKSRIVGAGVSDVGRVRTHNEDAYYVDPDAMMFMVADGMGGHAAGDAAAQTAVRVVVDAWSSEDMAQHRTAYAANGGHKARRALVQQLRAAVLSAHFEIVREAREDAEKAGMGTTFTGFMIAGGDAVFAHAGDSRAYLVRDGIAMRLSEDHTVLARMEAAGLVTGSENRERERWRGVLTNALGIGDATRVATFFVPLYSGDRFLLCSDGVHEYLDEAEVGELMVRAEDPQAAANDVVQEALERGGADNATAVAIEVTQAGMTAVPPQQRERDQKAIAECRLFAELSPQERLRALRICTWREHRPGTSVPPVALGERVAHIVLEGEAKGPRGCAGAGTVLYPDGLVAGTQKPSRSGQWVAQTPLRLLTIRLDDFLEITEEESDLGVKLYAAVARLMAS